MSIIYKFITIIGCSRVPAESTLVNAFREFLNVSLEWRLGLYSSFKANIKKFSKQYEIPKCSFTAISNHFNPR